MGAQEPHGDDHRPGGLVPRQRDAQDVVIASPHSAFMDNVDSHANAVRTEPGVCWRMVSRGPGYRVDTPTDCPEPVRWTGRTVIGKTGIRLWSCQRHVQGLDDVHPVRTSQNAPAPHGMPRVSRYGSVWGLGGWVRRERALISSLAFGGMSRRRASCGRGGKKRDFGLLR